MSNGASRVRRRDPAARHRTGQGKALAFLIGGKLDFAARVNLPAVAMPERYYMRSSLAEVADEIAERGRANEEYGISEAWLEIKNPEICGDCFKWLKRMVPPGTTLHVLLPDGTDVQFAGEEP